MGSATFHQGYEVVDRVGLLAAPVAAVAVSVEDGKAKRSVPSVGVCPLACVAFSLALGTCAHARRHEAAARAQPSERHQQFIPGSRAPIR